MSGDAERTASLGPRTLLAVALVGALLGAGLVMAAGPDRAPVTDDVPLRSPDGVTVTINTGSGLDLQTGNPFPASNVVEIRNTTFIGASGSTALDFTGRNDTHVSIGSLSGDTVQVNFTKNKPSYGVTSPVSSATFNKTLNVSADNSAIDISYTAGAAPNVSVFDTNVSQGRGLFAETATGTVIDGAIVDSDGDARFDDLTSGSISLNVKTGSSKLTIYNKSAPSTKVTKDIRVRFYDGSTLVRQTTTSNGEVDLSNLDLSESYTIEFKDVSTTPAYESQVISVSNLVDQTEVYLIPKKEPTAVVIFELEDLTGNFPGDNTALRVEEPITKDYDGDNNLETKYQLVAGDIFGSDERLTTTLADQETFRLRVKNVKTGDSREMGNYQTNGNDTVTLRIEQVTIPIGNETKQPYVIRGEIDNSTGTRQIKVAYRDVEDETSEVRLNYTFRNNGSSFHTTTLSGPLGRSVVTYDISSHRKNLSYAVHYEIDRNGTVNADSGTLYLGEPPDVETPLDPRWQGILGIISIVAVGGLLVIVDDSLGALGMTLTATLLTMVGIVSIPGAALGMAGGISVLAIIGRP